MFSINSYNIVRQVDKLISMDIYCQANCPSKLKAIINVITKLYKKIFQEIYENIIRSQQINLYLTIQVLYWT